MAKSNAGRPARAKQPATARIRLGVVGVDTAQLLIIDPAYLDMAVEEHPEDGTLRVPAPWDLPGFKGEGDIGQMYYPMGHAGLGVTFMPGDGDGIYEVWGTMREDGTLTKVEILLIPSHES